MMIFDVSSTNTLIVCATVVTCLALIIRLIRGKWVDNELSNEMYRIRQEERQKVIKEYTAEEDN